LKKVSAAPIEKQNQSTLARHADDPAITAFFDHRPGHDRVDHHMLTQLFGLAFVEV